MAVVTERLAGQPEDDRRQLIDPASNRLRFFSERRAPALETGS